MNKFKIPLIFTAAIYGIYKLLTYILEDNITPALVFLIPVIVLGLNLILRKKLRFKNWFLSKWNILLEKKHVEFDSDISIEFLFPKLKEVITESNYKLLDISQSNNTLLIGTSASFWTWGENIYIKIEQKRRRQPY